jgi:hypothetical protein
VFVTHQLQVTYTFYFITSQDHNKK